MIDVSKRKWATDAGTTELITLGADHRALYLRMRTRRIQRRDKKKKKTLKSNGSIRVGWKPDDGGRFSIATDMKASELRQEKQNEWMTKSIDEKFLTIEKELIEIGAKYTHKHTSDEPGDQRLEATAAQRLDNLIQLRRKLRQRGARSEGTNVEK